MGIVYWIVTVHYIYDIVTHKLLPQPSRLSPQVKQKIPQPAKVGRFGFCTHVVLSPVQTGNFSLTNFIWCLWCYSECISTPGKLEKYAWPRWESNLRPLEYYSPVGRAVAQLAEHWASIPKVVGSITTVARHIFQACPVHVDIHSE